MPSSDIMGFGENQRLQKTLPDAPETEPPVHLRVLSSHGILCLARSCEAHADIQGGPGRFVSFFGGGFGFGSLEDPAPFGSTKRVAAHSFKDILWDPCKILDSKSAARTRNTGVRSSETCHKKGLATSTRCVPSSWVYFSTASPGGLGSQGLEGRGSAHSS